MRPLLLSFAALLMTANALASSRDFVIALPGRTLSFAIPVNWQVETLPREVEATPVIEVRPESGDAFVLSIVPRWSDDPSAGFNTAASIKALVRAMAERVGPTTEEGKPVMSAMKTSAGIGYWFWATTATAADSPSNYEYFAMGALPAGALLIEFTARTRARPPESLMEILAALGTLAEAPAPK